MQNTHSSEPTPSSQPPAAIYADRLAARRTALVQLNARLEQLSYARLATFLLALILAGVGFGTSLLSPWFALVPAMVLFTRAATVREAVARGWWFGAGYLIAMLYWMAPEIGPGLVLLGAVMGWMWSPFAVAVNRLVRPALGGKCGSEDVTVQSGLGVEPEGLLELADGLVR